MQKMYFFFYYNEKSFYFCIEIIYTDKTWI